MNPGKVIGYFASKRGAGQFCDKTALIITGSEGTMRKAMLSRGVDPSTMMIQKTRMGEIMNGISAGGAYAFDAEAYQRFAPEAETAGIPRQNFDFTPTQPGLIKFLILEPRAATAE
jgi:hypothetical protein